MNVAFKVFLGLIFIFFSFFSVFILLPASQNVENPMLLVTIFFIFLLLFILVLEQIALNVAEYLQIRPVKAFKRLMKQYLRNKKCRFCYLF